MKNKLTPFQIIIFGVLIVAIILSVLLFSVKRSSKNVASEPIDMWGVLDNETIKFFIDDVNKEYRNTFNINYREIPVDQFESVLVESLASGNGPDMVLMPDNFFLSQKNKLYKISYESYPQINFQNSFIEAGEFLLDDDGIYGLPFTIDPLVLYWNRSILNSAGIARPPSLWDDFVNIVPRLVQADSQSFRISKSAIALGEFDNINHAKEIFINLIMQAGNPIITKSYNDKNISKYISILNDNLGYSVSPAGAALDFYTQFSNPSKNVYTWNRSLPDSKDMFLAGDSAFYIGFASEFDELKLKNPNLNFSIAELPQSTVSGPNEKTALGKMHFVGIIKNSEKIASAFDQLGKLTLSQNQKILNSSMKLPSVKRDLLTEVVDSATGEVFNRSALISKVFLDPNEKETSLIFEEMIESYISGRYRLSEAIQRASSKISNLIPENR